jgi:hypothetical protein
LTYLPEMAPADSESVDADKEKDGATDAEQDDEVAA